MLRCSWPDRHSGLIEAMQAAWIRNHPDPVVRGQIELANTSRRQCADLAGVDVDEGIAAEMLGDQYRSRPAFARSTDLQVLWPYTYGGGALLGSRLSRNEVHFRRSDESGHKQVRGPFIQL